MFKNILFQLFVTLIIALPVRAQWQCLYATWDDAVNGTGHNTQGAVTL